jgi:hypothetical protein
VFIVPVETGGTLLYRVRVGPVDDSNRFALQQQLEDSGPAGQPLPKHPVIAQRLGCLVLETTRFFRSRPMRYHFALPTPLTVS